MLDNREAPLQLPTLEDIPMRLTIPALCVVALLAVCASGTTATAASSKKKPHHKTLHLGGKWSGTYSGPFSGTFKIDWTQSPPGRTGASKLIGTIHLSSPDGKYDIAGSIKGTVIHFGAVSVGARYTGSVSSNGKSMSGRWTSPQGGGPWSADKTS
jgi:hypothetical protein